MRFFDSLRLEERGAEPVDGSDIDLVEAQLAEVRNRVRM
jgi:hypothetical protein